MTKVVATSERVVELDGRRWVYLARRFEDDTSAYSFDGGGSWRVTVVDAYAEAKATCKLIEHAEIDPSAPQDEMQAFTLGLMRELAKLENGEVIKVIRQSDTFYVQKATVVLAARASALQELKEEPDAG